MTRWIADAALLVVGLGGGLAVGGGLVAFLTVLDIIPRLAMLLRKYETRFFESAVIAGALYWTLADFFDWRLPFDRLGAAVVGAVAGVFVGMLAAALTEVLNVIPILAKRLRMSHALLWLIFAMIVGKVAGALVQWLWFQ